MTKNQEEVFLSNFLNVFEFLSRKKLIVPTPEMTQKESEALLQEYLDQCEAQLKQIDPNIIINELIKRTAELKPMN
jgi:hypothetical protein